MLGVILLRLFSLAGHRVEHVTSGWDAWDLLSRNTGGFDVLMTDHEMPGLNGLELVDLLRQTDFSGRIIVHSSALTPSVRQRYGALGVDHIVEKTTPAEALLEIVEACDAS